MVSSGRHAIHDRPVWGSPGLEWDVCVSVPRRPRTGGPAATLVRVLLAFDTATRTVAVALHDGTRVVAERVSEQEMRHGEQLAPLIEAVLRDVGADRHDLSAVAVGVGPGPFTGLRVGLVTARTLAYARQIPVSGICTLDVLAVEAAETGKVEGEFVVATDARRKEVYVATYDAHGRRLSGPDVVRPAEAATRRPVVGAGARLYPEAFPHAAGPVRPSAGWLARVVLEERAQRYGPDPLYLRRPDAALPGQPKRVS
jgi:tRNA threonylcarbamoyladenosine biosynthesis protein TsaB